MGGSNNSKVLPEISSNFIRHHRSIFRNKKKDYRDLLQKDITIQDLYKKERISSGIDPDQLLSNNGPIQYTEDFFKRFDDVPTVRHILFSLNEELSDTLHDVEEDLLDKSLGEKKISEPLSPEYKKNTFPIKLYIAEPPQKIKDAASELSGITKTAVGNKLVGLFGLVHAALQIGDKMVHFLDNHFVKIDQFKANQALYLISISESGRLPKTDQVETAIAEVIVEWNKFALYDRTYLNCQDFVEDLCREVNERCKLLGTRDELKLSFENTIIKEYIEELIDHPEKSGFYIKHKGQYYEFESHRDLDEWQDKFKDELTLNEKAFLKGFHRAFQLRHAAAKLAKNTTFIKLYQADPNTGCIIGNETLI